MKFCFSHTRFRASIAAELIEATEVVDLVLPLARGHAATSPAPTWRSTAVWSPPCERPPVPRVRAPRTLPAAAPLRPASSAGRRPTLVGGAERDARAARPEPTCRAGRRPRSGPARVRGRDQGGRRRVGEEHDRDDHRIVFSLQGRHCTRRYPWIRTARRGLLRLLMTPVLTDAEWGGWDRRALESDRDPRRPR